MNNRLIILFTFLSVAFLSMAACTLEAPTPDADTSSDDTGSEQQEQPTPTAETITRPGELGIVVNVIDGDTIDVLIDGREVRVRYVGVNTPERDEPCYAEATQFNADLVADQTVRLERDSSDTDRFNRLLRYIYVGDTFVNAELVRAGYAEAVLYEPDDREFDFFTDLEAEATAAGAGCHPTGIFDDGTGTR